MTDITQKVRQKAMAPKATKTTEETPTGLTYEELLASFTPEELAAMREASGQAANSGYDKIPTLKVNYCTLADKQGRTIKEGNWVILQDTGKIEVEVTDEDGDKTTEIRVEDIGVDLGKNPKITIYCLGQMYSFYPDSGPAEDRCRSQLVFDSSKEAFMGNNLPYACREKDEAKMCPRRKKDCARSEKCACQWVVFCEVTLPDEERIKALLYVKGASYMPFGDFLKTLGTTPVFFCPIKLSTKQEISPQGKPYYVMNFTALKDKPFPAIEVKANVDVARTTRAAAEEQNGKHKKALLESRRSSGIAQLVDRTAGAGARDVTTIEDDDDIEF